MRALIGALSAISGYWLAALLDASIAGAMVTMARGRLLRTRGIQRNRFRMDPLP